MSSTILCACICVLGVLPAYRSETPPKISIKVPAEEAFEGRQIPLYITVDHLASDSVEQNSFELNNQPLRVEALQKHIAAPEELYGSDTSDALAVDTYLAMLPAMPRGIHPLGPVTVVVKQARYSSGVITVHVKEAMSAEDFRLEAKVVAPPKIYLGQEVQFVYRVYFSRTMQLTKETLPLLSVKGFIAIGPPEISTERQGACIVQTIAQKGKAAQVGHVDIPDSLMEGMAIKGEGAAARPIPPLYRAVAPKLSLTVLAFPDRGRPDCFDGALGSFTWRASGLADSKVAVGAPLTIEYRVSGRGDLQSVQFPAFDRLEGLSEYFWTEVQPPNGEIVDGTKKFLLTLRPKKVGKLHIPGFLFCSFDPISEKYLLSTIPPIQLTVFGSAEAPIPANPPSATLQQKGLAAVFELSEQTSQQVRIPTSLLFSCLALATCLGLMQSLAKKTILKAGTKKEPTSRELFYKAFRERSDREGSLKTLKKAFFLALFELKLSSTLADTPEMLDGEGLVADIRGFLQFIDKQLYTRGGGKMALSDIQAEASLLYHRLKGLYRGAS